MKWAIVIERSKNGYGAYAPDLPGVGVVGDTAEEVRTLLADAIELYLEEVERDEGKHPVSEARVEYLELSEPVV